MLSLNNYKTIFESSPGLFLVLSKDLTIVAVSDEYASITLTKREEILDKYLFEVFPDNPGDPHSNGVSMLKASLQIVLETKRSNTMAIQKYDIRRPDGGFEEKYWSPINKPVLNESNEIDFIIHRVWDVTEFVLLKKNQSSKTENTEALEKRVLEMEIEIYNSSQELKKINNHLEEIVAERTKALLNIENKYFNTLSKMLEGVQIISFEWRYLYLNDSIVEQSGYKKEELLGFTMMEKYPGIEQTSMFKVLEKCMYERTIQHIENEFYFPNNDSAWFDLRIQPVEEGILILSIDISDRKIAEQEIEIKNKKLLYKNKELEQFTYIASHDLQEPLRTITSFAQLIQEEYSEKLDTLGSKYLSFIISSSLRMRNLVKGLLDYSRIGNIKKPEIIDCNNIVEDVLKDLSFSINENNAIINRQQLPLLSGDSLEIRQLFQNLISNAIKFRKKDIDPVINIEVKDQNKFWCFSVSDNGIGIENKFSEKVFIIFRRLHNRSEYEGTGIGLSHCKKIVEEHNGDIWFESQLNVGTKFYFTMPKLKNEK